MAVLEYLVFLSGYFVPFTFTFFFCFWAVWAAPLPTLQPRPRHPSSLQEEPITKTVFLLLYNVVVISGSSYNDIVLLQLGDRYLLQSRVISGTIPQSGNYFKVDGAKTTATLSAEHIHILR